jgi:hypothetical protein
VDLEVDLLAAPVLLVLVVAEFVDKVILVELDQPQSLVQAHTIVQVVAVLVGLVVPTRAEQADLD